MKWLQAIGFLAAMAMLKGCGSDPESKSITLTAGTTLQDSGLFDVLLPRYKAETGIDVRAIAVGTGQALEIAKGGDADALLTHSPAAEQEFLNAGWAESRVEVFWNDFLVAGPADDSAGVKGSTDALDAFKRIADAKTTFVSRGDDSGNHKLELKLWREAGIDTTGLEAYVSVGSGMGAALRVANERRAYILVDRGTWLAMRAELELAVLHEGDPKLVNQYAVLVVNPAKHPHARVSMARQFAEWLQKDETTAFIGSFGKDRFGEPLFKVGSANSSSTSEQ
jgi:tungstate transport system substrate-binding protein